MNKSFNRVQTLKSSDVCNKYSKSVSYETLVGGTTTIGTDKEQTQCLSKRRAVKPLTAVGTLTSLLCNSAKVVEKWLQISPAFRLVKIFSLIVVLSTGIVSKSRAETWDCGKIENTVNCTLDENGVFKVSGSGEMKDYGCEVYDGAGAGPSSSAPWGGSRAAMAKIKSIIVENGVTRIGSGAFTGATKLMDVSMPGVEVIGELAFRDARILTEAYMPKVEKIETGGFNWNVRLKSVYAPNIKTIGYSAFAQAGSLEYIEMGNNVSIGSSAFYGTKISDCGSGGTCMNCVDKYILLGKGCVADCPNNFKINDGWCDRIRYTPAEAAAILTDDNNNSVTITFRK